jgi:hypothetical protein
MVIIALGLLAASCGSGPKRQQAIGEAYVGPISLNLREDLAPRARVTATARHGDRLEILERRRRFAKVRTSSGVEGWTDGRQLLSPQQMSRLRHTAEIARRLPSQGEAAPFDLLNVHIAANRQSPSFYQLTERDRIDVIGHRVTPRAPSDPQQPAEQAADGVPRDAWSYVRLRDGRAGWVLTRMIRMAIPDEVAQYAEGHHITSYFALGSVEDRRQTKHHWLWTTISSRLLPYHFDSLRVFVWSTRRHRYETAHIERNLRGYYPVEVHPVAGHSMARFSLNFAGRDGALARRTYEFQGYRVRMIARAHWELPVEEPDEPPTPEPDEPADPQPKLSLADRLRQKWNDLFN